MRLFGLLSSDIVIDVATVLSTLGGFLTGLALLSDERSWGISLWLDLLQFVFGQGIYVLPILMTAGGIWLIMRRLEAADASPPAERLFGSLLIGIAGLSLLEATSDTAAIETAFGTVQNGGWLGSAVYNTLRTAFGQTGVPIAMASLLAIGTLLVLGRSLRELIEWIIAGSDRSSWTWPNITLYSPSTFLDVIRQWWHGVRIWVSHFRKPAVPLTLTTSLRPSTEDIPTQETRWGLPPWREILDDALEGSVDPRDVREKAKIIEETLSHFDVPARVVEVNRGPRVTRFGVEPGYKEKSVRGKTRRRKVKVRTITNLANDITLALAAERIRIEAPVPGRPIVGIEVPNSESDLVTLKSVMETDAFHRLKGTLPIALGRDVSGAPVVAGLDKMPHLLIAGATGSGKSVCINSIVACLLCRMTPDQLRFLMIDPKMVELVGYKGIPHLVKPIVTDLDRVVEVLRWLVREMERRYVLFSAVAARNLSAYNQQALEKGDRPLPYVVLVVDELADLMMVAPDEVENHICRLAQMARATGIHLIIATQRPSVDVVTGLIKANFPARIAFAVSSQVDSRVILDRPGAETLLGSGDMLYLATDASIPRRAQGCYVSDRELRELITYWRVAEPAETDSSGDDIQESTIMSGAPPDGPLEQKPLWDEEDSLLPQARELAKRHSRISEELLKRRLRIGEARAAKLINVLAAEGIIDPETNRSKIRRSS